MVEEDDWRLAGNKDFLIGLVLHWMRWRQTRPQWDHDHCEFCWEKFMDIDDPEILKEGYTDSNEYYWICKTCFEDLRDRFHWKENPPSTE